MTSGEYCGGCKPPLTYFGGPVLDTRGPHGLTVTPIYWVPPGPKNAMPAAYRTVINTYIADVAAASGARDNVYSIGTEYYDILGGLLRPIRYHITAGAAVVDTRPLPRPRCRAAAGESNDDACVTTDQLEAELNHVLVTRHLPRGLAHFYPFFSPPGVRFEDQDYCAYHDFTGGSRDRVVFGNEPYPPDGGCSDGQSPNHNLAADAAVDTLSHELLEAMTDPVYSGRTGWQDKSGSEIADLCDYNYGPPLGSTDPAQDQSTEYNQVINGHRYYTQTVFSNYAYRRFGVGLGCKPSESVARGQTGPHSAVAHMHLGAFPHTLPARRGARSSIFVQVYDKHGVDISDDRISFATYLLSGKGRCGTVGPHADITDGAGTVDVTYRASRFNVACVIVATDALGGKSGSAVVYQGTKRSIAPRAGDKFPARIIAGRRAGFTTSFRNPMRNKISGAQASFAIYSAGSHPPNVRARQVHVSVSFHRYRGPFVPVRLTGSTGEAGITGVIGRAAGFTFRARHKLTLTYRIRVSRHVPRRRHGPIFQFQAYLGQVNPASGGDTALTETRTVDVKVR